MKSRTPTDKANRGLAGLAAGKDPVRIVCFGDSITGVYYHSGGRRAYCDMLGLALQQTYPHATLELINAGISGDDTVAALARLEHDVLARKPHLVTIMFGMNDCIRFSQEVFRENLALLVNRCRESGAAVVLCTPNSNLADSGRPVGPYAETVRATAKALSVPLADCHQAFEAVCAQDALAWSCLMSDANHPSMNGHKLMAETIAAAISDQRVKLAPVPPYSPAVTFTFDRLARRQPVSVVAPPPYDDLLPKVLRQLYPDAVITMTTWPVRDLPLNDIAEWAKRIRDMPPDLVAVAVPADAAAADDVQYIRSYDWVLNWSLAFATQTWDTFVIMPTVTAPHLGPEARHRTELTRRVVIGKDIGYIERPPRSQASAEFLVRRWFKARQREWKEIKKQD